MKAVNIAHACPPVVAGALLCWSRAAQRDRNLVENAIAFYMYVTLDI